MKCKYEPCHNQAKGNSEYCGKSCRAQHSRRNKTGATSEAQQVVATNDIDAIQDVMMARTIEMALDKVEDCPMDYTTNPDKFAKRTAPEKLNWGKRMTQEELKSAGLVANRIPIPGDHDYAGCCVQADGVWQVEVPQELTLHCEQSRVNMKVEVT